MKTLLVFTAGALMAGATLAQGDNFTAPTVQRRALPPLNPAQAEGSIQRGFRLGNPAQMFNPFAPQKYGDGHEFVAQREEHDIAQHPRDNARPQPVGLRLFSFAF